MAKSKYRRFVRDLCTFLGVSEQDCKGTGEYGTLWNAMDKMVTISTTSHKFQVIKSSSNAPEHPIAMFHSTIVMNILGGDHISIAYPRYTMEGKGILHPAHPSPIPQAAAIIKYINRGFALSHSHQGQLPFVDPQTCGPYDPEEFHDSCGQSYTCPLQTRSFYDDTSLIIPVGSNHVQLPEWSVEWTLGGFGCGNGCVPFASAEADECPLNPRECSYLHFAPF